MAVNTSDNFTIEHCWSIKEVSVLLPDWKDIIDETYVQVIFGVAYAFLMAVGLLGNGAVLYCLCCTKKDVNLRVRSMFLLCLAFSDSMILIICLPVTYISYINREWLFGEVFCHMSGTFMPCFVFGTSFAFAAIAIDSFFVVLRPGRTTITYKIATVITGLIWVSAFVLALPVGIFSRTMRIHKFVCEVHCIELWPDDGSRRFFAAFAFTLQYLIPSATTFFCYLMIVLKVNQQIAGRRSHGGISLDSERKMEQRRNRTTWMTASMVATFMVLWLPLNILNFAKEYGHTKGWKYETLIGTLCHITGMASAVCNPIIYSWFNDQFREIMLFPVKQCIRWYRMCNAQQRAAGEGVGVDETELRNEANAAVRKPLISRTVHGGNREGNDTH